MNRLNFNQLYYFYVVAKEGSIKAASKKLHLTQPTISAQIKQLEEDLGHELFERKHRKLVLNPIGKATLKQSEAIFKMADHLQESLLKEGGRPIRDQFRVGAIQSLSNSFIYEFSMQLWKDKSIQMEVQQGALDDLIKKLNESELDVILTDQPFSNSKRYVSSRVSQDKLYVVATPSLSQAKKNFPQSLSDLSYLGFSTTSRFQQDVDHYFQAIGIQPDHLGRADDVTLVRVVTEQSNCFSVLPSKAVKESLKEKRLIKLGELPKSSVGIWATYPVVSPSAPMVKRVISNYFKRQD